MKEGLIIPSFRTKKAQSFHDILNILKGGKKPTSKILGMSKNSEGIADHLYRILNNSNFTVKFWPNYSVGLEFEKLLKKYFINSKNINCNHNKIWQKSKIWREEIIPEGVQSHLAALPILIQRQLIC